jgi:hypothetical protein
MLSTWEIEDHIGRSVSRLGWESQFRHTAPGDVRLQRDSADPIRGGLSRRPRMLRSLPVGLAGWALGSGEAFCQINEMPRLMR